jgi:cytidylate kinase
VHPEVRGFVNERMHLLQKYVRHPFQGLIVDGRDIGTVVFPDADAKIFLTADATVRAGRRNKELSKNPEECLKEAVDSRDVRDTTRAAAPLAPAEDAIVIDTTHLSEKQVFEQIQTLMQDKFNLQEASYDID